LPITPTDPSKAVPAYAFLASIGINFWPSNDGTKSQVKNLLTYIGVRWVRGTVGPGDVSSGHHYEYIRSIAKDLNNANPNLHFKVIYLLNANTCSRGYGVCYTTNEFNNTEIPALRALANDGILLGMEGPNEPDNQPVTWNGVTGGGGGGAACTGSWNTVAQFQAAAYAAFKADSTLKNYPVFHLTFGGGACDNAGIQWIRLPDPIPSGVISSGLSGGQIFADRASLHNYSNQLGLMNNQWDMTLQAMDTGHGEGFYNDYVHTWKSRHRGYTTAQAPAVPVGIASEWGGNSGTNETQRGSDLINGYVEHFIAGEQLSSWYSMVDNDGGYPNSQGIFYAPVRGAQAQPKLAATWLHNFTTILDDTTSNFTLKSTNWSISGCPVGGTANVSVCHGLLLQTSDGRLWL
jgi:hypothetical protein